MSPGGNENLKKKKKKNARRTGKRKLSTCYRLLFDFLLVASDWFRGLGDFPRPTSWSKPM